MEFAVVGGDLRFAYLTRLLCSCGRDARAVRGVNPDGMIVPQAGTEDLPRARNVIVNWPVPNGEELLDGLAKGTRVYFCGPRSPKGWPAHINGVDLWKDEGLLTENARLTAEGAVAAAMHSGERTISGSRSLVIGWGRIGRALTEILIGMGGGVTVASRSERGRNSAAERGAESVSTENLASALPGKHLVFSTPPHPVLESRELENAERDVRIIDLASAPYGVDLEAAKELGLRAWREPGLPGRYCPFSAAEVLMRAIFRAEKEAF